jgi:hypothetical protein
MDLDFEAPNVKGFYTGGDGYSVQLDSKIFHSGKQSLRMTKLPVVNNPKAVDAGIAASSWKTVLDHMKAAREEYQKKGFALSKIDWAIQNARVVCQYALLQAKEVTRDFQDNYYFSSRASRNSG